MGALVQSIGVHEQPAKLIGSAELVDISIDLAAVAVPADEVLDRPTNRSVDRFARRVDQDKTQDGEGYSARFRVGGDHRVVRFDPHLKWNVRVAEQYLAQRIHRREIAPAESRQAVVADG